MSKSFAAVDLGAQSGRVAIGRFDGATLAVDVVHRFANVPLEDAARLQWDAARLRAEVEHGLRKVADTAVVDSVAVDSWAVDFGLLDDADALIRNPVHYRDARRAAAFDAVLERIPARELYERTAVQLLPINTLFELAAMRDAREPELDAARHLLLVPDLFHHWLSGCLVTERTNASTTQCFDPRAGAWANDLLERLEIPTRILPEVVEPGTVIGAVGGTAMRLDGASVVAGATHDTAAAVAAVPLGSSGAAYLSVGTWSLVGIECDAPVVTEAAYRVNLTNEGGVGGTFRVLRNLTGLWLLHECRRTWAAAGRSYAFDELVELARTAAPHRALIDPNDPTFAEPGDMPARIGAYCRRTGQEPPADVAATVRCVLESLALKHAETVELLVQVTGRPLDELHIVGGGANNPLLCAWTAEAAQRPVVAGPDEATLIGNVLVQALALGELASLAEGRELVRASFPPTTYEPTGETSWVDARARFAELSPVSTALEVCA